MKAHPFVNWTAEQRAEMLRTIADQAHRQIERDPELRAVVDWMIEACELEPSVSLYRLVFLASVVMDQASRFEEAAPDECPEGGEHECDEDGVCLGCGRQVRRGGA